MDGAAKGFKPTRPCRFFNTPRGCQYGQKCAYIHDKEAGPSREPSQDASTVDKLQIWQVKLRRPKPLGHGLSSFFSDAYHLVSTDFATRQEVISSLSSERGLQKIVECIEQGVFHNQILPLFKTVTHPGVRSSIILESKLATIFTSMFGVGGARGQRLFTTVAAAIIAKESDSLHLPNTLEASLCVLLNIVEHNSSAVLMPCFSDFAVTLGSTIPTMLESDVCADARRHFERLSKRLEVVKSMPELEVRKAKSSSAPVIPFHLHQDRPGRLQNGEPRHNNDFDDICKISIMPTFEEIVSSHSEYLPLEDISTWHKQGLAGLLDRQFRLLHEDTIGQLRDSVRLEMQALVPDSRFWYGTGKQANQGARTYTYRDIKVNTAALDAFIDRIIR